MEFPNDSYCFQHLEQDLRKFFLRSLKQRIFVNPMEKSVCFLYEKDAEQSNNEIRNYELPPWKENEILFINLVVQALKIVHAKVVNKP